MAVIANVALTNTFETWRTRTNIGFTRLNQFAINESALYANTITANVAFTSKGTMLQTGAAVFGSTIRYGGVTLANTVTGTGSLVLATSPSVTTLTVTSGGATVTAGGLTVSNGSIQLKGNKLHNYTENADAYTNLTGSATVPTNTNVVRYTVTGAATLTLPSNMPNQTGSVKNIIIVLKENGTGGYAVTLAAPSGESIVYNNSATQPANQTGANKVTIYQCMKFDSDTRWYVSMGFYEA